jgi:leucyl/phenylalanyl-tRNA--protein transferase
VLNWHLAHWGFAFNDGKLMTPTCHDMGFREISRRDYLDQLTQAVRRARQGRPLASGSRHGDGRRLAACLIGY